MSYAAALALIVSITFWAIREGREVAREVDESLMGYSYLEVQ